MKQVRLFSVITSLTTLFFVILQLLDPTIIREQLESKTYDLRLRLRNLIRQPSPSVDVVIVSIDEKSISEIGRWPWRRDVLALLINKLSEEKPKAMGIDIMLLEKESTETDRSLADAIGKAGNVVLAMPFFVPVGKGKASASGETPDVLWDAAFMEVKTEKGIPWKTWAVKAERAMPPVAEMSRVASLGHVYIHPDMDGVTRWEILALNYGDDWYPQFSLQVARVALGIEMKDMVLYGGSGVGLGNRFIPTDLSGRVLINYRGKENSFAYVSASGVIQGRTSKDFFRGKIVLVGTSALAVYDQKVTPFSGNTPGVEVNATVVENILLNNFLRKSPGFIEVIVLIFTGLGLGFILPRLKALAGMSLATGFIAFYIVLSFSLLIYHNLWINLIYPVTNMAAVFAIQTVIRFFYEEKKAQEIRRMFSSYVSPKIVHELIENPEKARLGGERRVVTVLFADIIGFTSLSEKRQPEEVVSLLNEYFAEMADIIFQWDGTLDKFVGDEIMALWGAPIEQPNHAELALQCAVNMSERLDKLQEQWKTRGQESLDIGIGINSGEVLIGNIGAQGKKMDYTAIGDHVNLAARVEKLTRRYGTRILFTENTHTYIEPLLHTALFSQFEVKELGVVNVKGKEKDTNIFGLKGRGSV